MPYIILPDNWRQQPLFPVSVDFNNPLAIGLVNSCVPAWRQNEFFTSTGSLDNFATQDNIAVRVNSTNYLSASTKLSSDADLSVGSLFVVYSVATANSPNRIAGRFKGTGGAASLYGYILSPNTTNYRAAIVASDSTFSIITGNSIVLNRTVYQTMSWGGGNLRFFDGSTIHTPLTSTIKTSASGTYRIGNSDDLDMAGTSDVVAAFLFNRILSFEEHYLLVENPWQIFRRDLGTVYFIPAASGNLTIELQKGSIALTGYAPVISQPNAVSPGKGSVAITGYAPIIQSEASQVIALETGHISIAGYAPTILQHNLIEIETGHIVYTGYSPNIHVGVKFGMILASRLITVTPKRRIRNVLWPT